MSSDPIPFRTGRIALLGRPNVGKSSLLNHLLGEPLAAVTPQPQTTRDLLTGVVSQPHAQFVFVDTPGIHTPRNRLGTFMNRMARQTQHDADVLLFVTDIRKGPPEALVQEDLPLLSSLVSNPERVGILINKIDRLRCKPDLLPLLTAYSQVANFAFFLPLSIRTGEGCESLLPELLQLLPSAPKRFDDDTLSDRPMRFFVCEYVREQALLHLRAEVPHGVGVVVDLFDETSPCTRIEATIHVARASHKSILIGKGGAMLRSLGTAARLRMEALLGKRVHLQLWVRVTPAWYDHAEGLATMGYCSTETSL